MGTETLAHESELMTVGMRAIRARIEALQKDAAAVDFPGEILALARSELEIAAFVASQGDLFRRPA